MESAEFEHRPEIVVTPPVTEVLHDPAQSLELFADDSPCDSLLIEQIEQHQVCSDQITELLDALPETTISIEDALATGQVTESQTTHFYDSLSTLLQEPENARLILYFPFELMPAAAWQPEGCELREAATLFQETYLNAWQNLLHVQDVRANFVDGDVMEETYRDGDLPRVVKAAHLIPGLVARGLLTEADAIRLHDQAASSVLQQSIAEALAALHYDTLDEAAPAKPVEAVIQDALAAAAAIPGRIPDGVSDRRREWLEQTMRDSIITRAAIPIKRAIHSGTLSDAVIESGRSDANPIANHILLEGIRDAVLTTAAQDQEGARALFNQCYPMLTKLYEHKDTETAGRLAVSFRQFFHAGVINKALLDQWRVDVSNLKGPLSENLANMHEDIARLGDITMQIATDPELSGQLYPVAVVGGSRLKGYGLQSSDVDVSVFIRPNVPVAGKQRVRALAQAAFTHSGVAYEPIEFWLDKPDRNALSVHNFLPADMHAADSDWTHVLFGGAWIGDKQAVNELQRGILPSYFYASTPADEHSRRLYLERMEQDLLQYRLMHKGYARHYAPQAREATTYSPAIDGASMFWDPGYRRLATRLFVNNVFLPKYTT